MTATPKNASHAQQSVASPAAQASPVFRLRDLIKPSFDLWLISWLLGLVTVFSVVGLLMVSGWFISATALAGMVALGSHAFNYMMPAAVIRTLAMMRTAGRYGELMVSHHAVFSLLKALRLKFFARLANAPLSEQRQALSSGQQTHRLVSDIDRLDEFVLRVVSPWLFASVLTLALAGLLWWLLPVSLSVKWAMTCLLLGAVIVPIATAKYGERMAWSLAEIEERRRNQLLEPLSILTQLILWRQWQPQTQRFLQTDAEHIAVMQRDEQIRQRLKLLVHYALFGSIVLILLVQMAHTTTSEAVGMNIPLLLAMILGLLGLSEIVLPLAQHHLAWGNSVVAKSRLNALFQPDISNQTHQSGQNSNDQLSSQNSENKNAKPVQTLPLPDAPLHATLTNVSARFPDAIAGATNIHAQIHSGKPLLIQGASGSGKTTLLQTLAGEMPVLAGDIELNGKPWHRYDWQDQLGYLGQQLDIFDQTLAVNLRLGKADASDAELMTALNKVGLKPWAMDLPQGLNTPLGEYGMAISGGQARRIALARLLLKPRQVMLLDEPFAGLDDATRQHVWQSVKQHQENGLLVLVSHQTWEALEADCEHLLIDAD